MPRHFGIRKRRELKGGRLTNIPKLAKEFEKMQVSERRPKLSPSAIKKKFSI